MSQVRHLLPLLKRSSLVAAVLLITTCGPSAGAGPKVKGIDSGTTSASTTEIEGATPVSQYMVGFNKGEPDACATKSGSSITELSTKPDSGERENVSLSVAPASYSLEGLLPGTTYRACLSVRSYSPDPVTIEVDDVDLKGQPTGDSTVALIDRSTGVGSWLRPSVRSFTAKKGFVYTFPFTIVTPPQLPAGTVVGGLRIVRNATAGQGGIQQAITQRLYISSPGGRHEKLSLRNVSASRFITGKPGQKAYSFRANVVNGSDYVSTFEPTLSFSGFGKGIAKQKVDGNTLLPTGQFRLTMREADLPWIGIFRPKLELASSEGKVTKNLPLVFVLPPTIYVVAILLALFIPIVYLIVRWRQRRAEWMAYLIAEMEAEERGESLDDAEEADEFWDPAAR